MEVMGTRYQEMEVMGTRYQEMEMEVTYQEMEMEVTYQEMEVMGRRYQEMEVMGTRYQEMEVTGTRYQEMGVMGMAALTSNRIECSFLPAVRQILVNPFISLASTLQAASNWTELALAIC